ncbi:RnfH family protein [Coxiella endosymbiont of Amblyomma sculptum]|nr:RnfH family protein [Coxiella endosymbiont of Amblyomma sculptum]
MITVSVCYATPEMQVEVPLTVERICTVAVAIKRSGILQRFPEIDLSRSCVGIYGKRTTPDTGIKDGDRIEIYRPLPCL